jgi:hypothetical protein
MFTKKECDTVAEIDAEIAKLQAKRETIVSKTWPQKLTYYLHSEKETNWDIAESLGLGQAASENFSYACYEVELDIEVSQDGRAVVTHFNGIELTKPAQIT